MALAHTRIHADGMENVSKHLTIPTLATMAIAGIGFRLTVNEKRRTELTEHYKRISGNVFKPWSDNFATLECNAGTLPYSFIPLYTNVISIIKSPGRYKEANSHLGNGYCYVNKILNDIEIRADNHNQQVASLITTLNNDIIDTIHNKNKHHPCNITDTIHQYNVVTASDPPWYIIGCIYEHFREEANDNHGKFNVVPAVVENMAVLRINNNSNTTSDNTDTTPITFIQDNTLP